MKILFVLITLVSISTSQALADSHVPQAACIPADQTDWPVKAIYLHGWFEGAGSRLTHSRRSEFDNRKHLEEMARRLQIRIALPIAPSVNRNGMRSWNNSKLEDIEKLAVAACDGAPLAEERSLIGYSNGGFAAKNIGLLPCDKLTHYSRVLSIGTQKTYTPRCDGKFVNVPAHVFPPNDLITLSGQPIPNPETNTNRQQPLIDRAESPLSNGNGDTSSL